MINILHLADVHIPITSERYTEYEYVFNELYNDIDKKKFDICFIVGDLFHSKLRLSPDSINMGYDFLQQLSHRIPYVIITLGNHDINVKNIKRLDAIYPIVKSLGGNIPSKSNISLHNNKSSLFLLRKSGNYIIPELSNLNIGVFSMLDKENYNIIEPSDIALFHGTVSGSKLDSGFYLQETEMLQEDFIGHKIVMLGDVHKYLDLNEEKTISYCGSTITQNFGESIYKGYLNWILDDNKRIVDKQFCILKNPFAHYTLLVNEDLSFPKADQMPSKAVLRIFVKRDSLTPIEEEDIKKRVKEQFNPSEIKMIKALGKDAIVRSHIDIDVKLDIDDVRDLQIQNKFIVDYLKNEKEEIIEKVLELNEKINNMIAIDVNRRNVKWSPKKLEFSNFNCFGPNNTINFKDYRGIVGIIAPNAHGKSSIINALAYNLFKATAHPSINFDDLIHKKKTEMKTSLWIEALESTYYIEREIKLGLRKKRKQDNFTSFSTSELNFYKILDTGEIITLNDDDKWKTDVKIREIFGTHEDFLLTTYAKQNKSMEFIEDKRGKDRKTILSNFFGLDVFNKKADIGKERLTEIEKKIKSFSKDNLLTELKTKREELAGRKAAKTKLENEKSIIEENIKKLDDDISLFKSKVVESLSESMFTSEDIKTKIADNNKLISNMNKELNEIEDKIKLINKEELEKEREELNKYISSELKLDKLNETYTRLETEEDQIKKTLGIFEEQPWCREKRCKFLSDAFDAEKRLPILIEEKKNLYTRLTTLKDKKTRLKSIDNILAQLKEDTNKIDLLTSKIESLESKNLQFVQEMLNIEKNKTSIEQNKIWKEKIEETSSELYLEKEKLKNINSDITKKSEQVGALKQTLQTMLDRYTEFKSLEEEYTLYTLYVKAMGINGIPLEIIRKSLPSINAKINKILAVFPFSVSLEMDPDGSEILPFIEDNKLKRRLENGSGMEKIISSIAIRAALISLSSLPKSDILVIDEGFSALDSSYLSDVATLLNELKTMFKTIFIISHISEIQDVCDMNIFIERTKQGFSFIKE